MILEFIGEVWHWRGPAPYHFVTVPEAESDVIKDAERLVTYGWGMIPVTVRIGGTEWTTSLWPKDGRYVVPLKDWVREGFGGLKAEDMKGSTTLSEITKLDGEPAARLLGEFKIENAGLQLPSLPEAIRAKRFKLELKDETEMPLDPAGTATRVKTQMNLESDSDGTLEQDDGKAVKVRVNLRQRCAVELSVSPVK